MPFSGLSTSSMFTAGPLNAEDVARQIALLAPDETPVLDWLGDPDTFAANTVHEWLEEELRPNVLQTSTALNSADVTATVADFGDLLTVGTVLEYQSNGAMVQITSIVGVNSIRYSVNYGGSGHIPNSVAVGAELYIHWPLALEGDDHPGRDVTRKRVRRSNYVSLFHLPVAISGTQLAVNPLGDGGNEMDHQKNLRLREALRDLEKMTLVGRTSGNSIGSSTAYRAANGLRPTISTVNSTVTASSFAANPHLYIGDVMEQAFKNGALDSEEWGIVAGRTYFRNISDMNDTKVQDSNASESFKRVIRNYQGPFGMMSVFMSRHIPATSALIFPRNRVKVVPLQGRSFYFKDIASTGDADKSLLIGEYTVEVHHQKAMAQLKS